MNCKNESTYEKIKKKIASELKDTKCCYVVGPTGPRGGVGPKGDKGDAGAATIEIGLTETGGYNEQALVTNTGTNKDVVLNFKIPQGVPGPQGLRGEKGDTGPQGIQGESEHINIGKTFTVESEEEARVEDDFENNVHYLTFFVPKGKKGDQGETGPIGPRGLPGEIGRSEHISIDGAETVETAEEAQVLDDFENNIHHLTFYIPKGPTGPTGLQGPRGEPYGIGAYGERYSDSTERFKITNNMETIIPLDKTGPSIFTRYNSTYAIEIKKFGTYQVNYFLNIATSEDVEYSVAVKASGIKLPGSEIKVSSKAYVIQNVYGSVTYGLVESDEVVLVIKAHRDVELIFDGTTNAKINVLKID